MSIRWPRRLTPTHLSQLIRSQKNPLKALEMFGEAKHRYPNYRHNGPVYAAMIDILGRSGRVAEMKEVICRMKEDSCECRDSIFASAIKTYASVGLLDEAIALFRSLPQFNCVNWTESFITLLKILVKESKLEATYHLFLENSCRWEVKSLTHALNLLIYGLCRIHRSDLALCIFQEMDYQCCYPVRETYLTLMRGLCEDGRLTEATHLLYSMLWRISQKGSGADVAIYRTLLDALCDNGEVQEAVEILSKVLRKGLKAPKRRQKQLDLSQINHECEASICNAKAFITKALIKGTVPSWDAYRSLAIDLYYEGKIDKGDEVLKEMYIRGLRPSSLIYEAKVAALFTSGMIDEAVDVIEREMVENSCVPTVRLYNTVIRGLCNQGKSDLALGYYEKMSRQVACVPNKETYDILVDGLCRDGKYIEASQMLEQMLIHSYWPGGETYTKVIHGLCIIGRPYKAVMWLEEMISQAKIPQISVWGSLSVRAQIKALKLLAHFSTLKSGCNKANYSQVSYRESALEIWYKVKQELSNLTFCRKEMVGINFTSKVVYTHLDLETVKAICCEYRIHCADINIKSDATADDFTDVIESSRAYISCI
ncbi:Pentatricopeptide repeat-containing protein [Abeliophyllum distichum]|uniref:Pentatricopeptide repeat-containing protein n=1 Tax=Abeliophyllum distichum TaxID=126358 RepID=A0ABD1QCV7_9LAMI